MPRKKTIDKLLDEGFAAAQTMYEEYLKRIKDGEKLLPTEIKQFHALEKRLESQADENRKEQAQKQSKIILTITDAAKYCKVSTQTIRYHLTAGTITQNEDGSFDSQMLDDFMKHRGRRVKPDGTPATAIERAELRIKRARARREEMLVKQMQGSLYSKKDIEEQWAARVLIIKTGLMNLVNRLPQLLVGKKINEIRDIIKDEVNRLLDDYRNVSKYTPDVDPDEVLN